MANRINITAHLLSVAREAMSIGGGVIGMGSRNSETAEDCGRQYVRML